MVEELSDDKFNLIESELENGSVGLQIEGEFARQSKDWSDIEELVAEEIVSVNEPTSAQIKVFNSGAMTHISPYHNEFFTFENIAPQPLCAANKQAFNAVGKGEVIIDLLNGMSTSQLHLSEVLYSPEAGYTLVLVG
jgi:hypothetical protein